MECGGLIMEPGVSYGYAGKVCYCANPKRANRYHTQQQLMTQQGGLSQMGSPSLLELQTRVKALEDKIDDFMNDMVKVIKDLRDRE